MKKSIALTLTALVASVAIATSAQAHDQARGDANDTRSPLDIKATILTHGDTHFVGAIRTYDGFPNHFLGPKGDLPAWVPLAAAHRSPRAHGAPPGSARQRRR
jgi:hypothetical protein